MNYRHAYHAGNFADVLKHAVLALIIEHLKLKPQPFRVIDVHAGRGLYDLESVEAGKTGEWRSGIGRLDAAPLSENAAKLFAPYLEAVRAVNPTGVLATYPGSPLIARSLMRRGDHLIANELHPEDFQALKSNLAGKPDCKVLNLDAFVALKALLPPKERRGIVLIDPPFEARDEFDRLAAGLKEAYERFETGIYLVWYPVKEPKEVSHFLRRIRGLGLAKAINATLSVAGRDARSGLLETGIVVVNPPYRLKERLEELLAELSKWLAEGDGAGFAIDDWSV